MDAKAAAIEGASPEPSEFRTSEVAPGSALLIGDRVVFNVDGRLCATQARCTHRGGLLNTGKLEGSTITCPLHGSKFDVCTGAVQRGPAKDPLATFRVKAEGELGRIESG